MYSSGIRVEPAKASAARENLALYFFANEKPATKFFTTPLLSIRAIKHGITPNTNESKEKNHAKNRLNQKNSVLKSALFSRLILNAFAKKEF